MPKSIDVYCCAYCQRSVRQIKGEAENPLKSHYRTIIELLYMSKDKHLVCPRCMLEYGDVLDLGGRPVIRWSVAKGYEVAEKQLKKVKHVTIDLYPDIKPTLSLLSVVN